MLFNFLLHLKKNTLTKLLLHPHTPQASFFTKNSLIYLTFHLFYLFTRKTENKPKNTTTTSTTITTTITNKNSTTTTIFENSPKKLLAHCKSWRAKSQWPVGAVPRKLSSACSESARRRKADRARKSECREQRQWQHQQRQRQKQQQRHSPP